MKTFDGYKKRNLTDDNVLLAGGGHKSITDLLAGYSKTDSKVKQNLVNSGYTNYRPLLVGASSVASGTKWSTVIDEVFAPSTIYAQPESGNLYIGGTTYLGGTTYYLGKGAATSYLYKLGIGQINTDFNLNVLGPSKFSHDTANILTLFRTTKEGGAFIDYYAANQSEIFWRVGSSVDHIFRVYLLGAYPHLEITTNGITYLKYLYPQSNLTYNIGSGNAAFSRIYGRYYDTADGGYALRLCTSGTLRVFIAGDTGNVSIGSENNDHRLTIYGGNAAIIKTDGSDCILNLYRGGGLNGGYYDWRINNTQGEFKIQVNLNNSTWVDRLVLSDTSAGRATLGGNTILHSGNYTSTLDNNYVKVLNRGSYNPLGAYVRPIVVDGSSYDFLSPYTSTGISITTIYVNLSQTTTSNWRPVVLGGQNATKSNASLYSSTNSTVYTTNILQYLPSSGTLSSTYLEATGAIYLKGSKSLIYADGDGANVVLWVDGIALLVCNKAENAVRRGISATTTTLGTATYQWPVIFGTRVNTGSYNYTGWGHGLVLGSDGALNGIAFYTGSGTTGRIYRLDDYLVLDRGGNAALRINTACNTETRTLYPASNHTYNLGTLTNVYEHVYTRYVDTDSASGGYDLRLCTGGTEKAHITGNTGNFVIGKADYDPGYKLNVVGDVCVENTLQVKGTGGYAEGIRIWDCSGYSSVFFRVNSAREAVAGMWGITACADGLRFRGNASTTTNSITDYMNILHGGNVGINNTTPSSKLHVIGTTTLLHNDWGQLLIIKRNHASNDCVILYANTSGIRGYIGCIGSGTMYPYFATDSNHIYPLLHTGNSSVSKSGSTLTVNINGKSLSLTNTDSSVYLSETTTTNYRPIELGNEYSAGSGMGVAVTGQLWKSNWFYTQPSSGTLYTKIYGFLHPTDATTFRGTLQYCDTGYGWGIKLTTDINGPLIVLLPTGSGGVKMISNSGGTHDIRFYDYRAMRLIRTDGANYCMVQYHNTAGCLGLLGFNSSSVPVYRTPTDVEYVLYHSGNWSHNNKVTQTYVDASAGYTNLRPILVGSSSHASTNSFSTVTDGCIAVGPIYAKPSAGLLYASAFYSTSDIRFKNIEEELIINVKQLSKLPLFNFTWNNGIDGKHSGTSAQEVMKILPNLVSGDEMLTLNYATLGTIAGITACKELVALKSEIDLLKDRIKELELQLKMINDYGRC